MTLRVKGRLRKKEQRDERPEGPLTRRVKGRLRDGGIRQRRTGSGTGKRGVGDGLAGVSIRTRSVSLRFTHSFEKSRRGRMIRAQRFKVGKQPTALPKSRRDD